MLIDSSMQCTAEAGCKESEDTESPTATSERVEAKETNQEDVRPEIRVDFAASGIEIADETDGQIVVFNKESTPISGYSKASGVSPHKSSRHSGSHVKRQNSKGRIDTSYQLSPDLQAMTVDLLANKYGGKEKANRAAKIIQEYYRHWVLSRSFRRVRAYSEKRKKSATQCPEYHFNAIKKKASVYDIENPVLIVDLDDEDSKNDSAYLQAKDNSSFLETEVELNERSSSFLKTMSRAIVVPDEKGVVGNDGRKILLPPDTVFYQGTPRESKVEREVRLGSSMPDSSDVVLDGIKPDGHEEQNEGCESSEGKKKVHRTESADSYEIIDGISDLFYITFF